MSCSVDMRLLRRGSGTVLKDNADIVCWLDLHDQITSCNGTLTITQIALADEWHRQETTVRNFLARLVKAGWISMDTRHRCATIRLSTPPEFIRAVAAGAIEAPCPAVEPVVEAPAAPRPRRTKRAKSPEALACPVAPQAPPAPARPMAPAAPAAALAPRAAALDEDDTVFGPIAFQRGPGRPVPPAKCVASREAAPTLPGILDAGKVVGPAGKFEPRPVPPEVAEEARHKALRIAFAEWVHVEYSKSKRAAGMMWNHWGSRLCYSPEQIEAAVQIAMERRPADPFSYVEGILRNPAGFKPSAAGARPQSPTSLSTSSVRPTALPRPTAGIDDGCVPDELAAMLRRKSQMANELAAV